MSKCIFFFSLVVHFFFVTMIILSTFELYYIEMKGKIKH